MNETEMRAGMRYKISYSLQAQLVQHDGMLLSSERLMRELDGLACHTDTVLNYVELPFAEECELRGGHPRLVLDGNGRLFMAVEIDSKRKLTRKELEGLAADLRGQLTDGIGTGCFDQLAPATGLALKLRFPLKPKFTQVEGTAWIPKPSSCKGNERRIAAAAKLVGEADSRAPAIRTTGKATAKKSNVDAPPKQKVKPNLQKLFRLLAKPERDQLLSQINAELEASGNDLSLVADGEYPYGNFNDPKLLRLLLEAGLSPEATDVKGNSLLIQAAVNPQCLELLLKRGADVNRVCDSSVAATALMRAASLGKRKCVELLLQQGADPKIKDKAGRSALDVIDKHSRDRPEIERLLRSAVRR